VTIVILTLVALAAAGLVTPVESHPVGLVEILYTPVVSDSFNVLQLFV
jgi:hypothetical protein